MEHPPIIEMDSFVSGSKGNRKLKENAVASLDEACRNTGFFYVKSPTIDDKSIQQAIESVKDFFLLSEDIKETATATKSKLFRGYQGVGSPSHSCAPNNKHKIKDVKESFVIGATGNASFMHGENQWPQKCPISVKQNLENYWKMMMELTREVVQCLALALGLEEKFFLKEMTDPIAQMVCLKYPANSFSMAAYEGENGVTGCGAHTDCGFLTLLIQEKDSSPLQIRNTSGDWVNAPQIEGCVLCNLGDMAERWSNKYYRSSWHRVNTSNKERHSIPFFCNLNYDAIVDPALSVCQGELKNHVGPAKFPSILAGDYICEKLNLMYKGKGENNERE